MYQDIRIVSTTVRRSDQVFITLKVKWSRYRPGVAQRLGRGIALLLHDRGTRRGWVVTAALDPGKDPIPTLQEAGWAPEPVWTGGKSRRHRDSFPDSPTRSQSLYQLSYPAHVYHINGTKTIRMELRKARVISSENPFVFLFFFFLLFCWPYISV